MTRDRRRSRAVLGALLGLLAWSAAVAPIAAWNREDPAVAWAGGVQDDPGAVTGPGGRVVGAEARLDVNPRGVTVLVEYELALDPGVDRVPVEAPVGDVGYAWELEAEWAGVEAEVRLESEGPPRTFLVVPGESGSPERGEIRLLLVYRLGRVVEVDESGGLAVRVPIASVPWPVSATEPAPFMTRLRLPPGIALVDASPGDWEREPDVENRLRYVHRGDTLPASVDVRAALAVGRPPSRAPLQVPLLIGGVVALALLAAVFVLRRISSAGST